LIGVFGSKENLPNEPDGIFLPPPKPRLHELMLKKAAKGIGIPVIPSRLSILTKPINKDRGSCFFLLSVQPRLHGIRRFFSFFGLGKSGPENWQSNFN